MHLATFQTNSATPADTVSTVNGPMARLAATLASEGALDPLTHRLPLLAIWGALHHLTGDGRSFWDAALLAADFRDGLDDGRPLCPAGRAIAGALTALHDELLAEGIPTPLLQPLTVGLVWADLCAHVGEEPPAAVLALLDGPAAG